MSEDAPHYGPMTEERAREILRGYRIVGEWLRNDGNHVSWAPGVDANLNGYFSADELEAIAWWMRNKSGQ